MPDIYKNKTLKFEVWLALWGKVWTCYSSSEAVSELGPLEGMQLIEDWSLPVNSLYCSFNCNHLNFIYFCQQKHSYSIPMHPSLYLLWTTDASPLWTSAPQIQLPSVTIKQSDLHGILKGEFSSFTNGLIIRIGNIFYQQESGLLKRKGWNCYI